MHGETVKFVGRYSLEVASKFLENLWTPFLSYLNVTVVPFTTTLY